MINLPPTQDTKMNNGLDNLDSYGSRCFFDPIHEYFNLGKK